MSVLPNDIAQDVAISKGMELVEFLRSFESVAVAFSGGVDSAVVAAAAHRALGNRAIAVTGIGAATPQSDLESARSVARAIGISHVELNTSEIEDERYVRNDAKRCYYCKSNLYSTLSRWAQAQGIQKILSGTNLEDLSDYRPGLQAADENEVVAPLASLQIDKPMVRAIARQWGLSVAEKPASPCLASRIAYGQVVTIGRLHRIEQLEQCLVQLGFQDLRVRLHDDALVRIELPIESLVRATDPATRQTIVEKAKELGFRFVTLDLAGRVSGSLNQLLPTISK